MINEKFCKNSKNNVPLLLKNSSLMKYYLQCKKCDCITRDFGQWFYQNQLCPQCGSKHAEVHYNTDYSSLQELYQHFPASFWHYFDFLPLMDKSNIISCGEGAIPIEKWHFLEDYAKKLGVDCSVFVYRNDLNGGTQTFKDVAASLAASLFKEHEIKEFTIASTGNTATAYSKYLSMANVKCKLFVPHCVIQESVDEIRSYGQEVVIVDGDYAYAKKLSAEYHEKNNVLISAGNIDPIRVEAKKTMVFEFMRQLGKMPDVYIQAVSGGTGPIAIDKGVRDIQKFYPEVHLPKIILVQQDQCDPMVRGWEAAEVAGFPVGYENHYPIIDNPQTKVSILSTGNPAMFPVVAPIVRQSGGTFLRIKESELIDCAKEIYKEKNLILGAASIVCMQGFYEALRQNRIKNGETVLVNTGESANRTQWLVKEVLKM